MLKSSVLMYYYKWPVGWAIVLLEGYYEMKWQVLRQVDWQLLSGNEFKIKSVSHIQVISQYTLLNNYFSFL